MFQIDATDALFRSDADITKSPLYAKREARRALAVELGVTFYQRDAYARAVIDRMAVAMATERRDGIECDPVPMGDCIISPTGGTDPDRDYTAKIGDCFTRFPSFDAAVAFVREVRAGVSA